MFEGIAGQRDALDGGWIVEPGWVKVDALGPEVAEGGERGAKSRVGVEPMGQRCVSSCLASALLAGERGENVARADLEEEIAGVVQQFAEVVSCLLYTSDQFRGEAALGPGGIQ